MQFDDPSFKCIKPSPKCKIHTSAKPRGAGAADAAGAAGVAALRLVGPATNVKGAERLDYSGLGLHVPDRQRAEIAKQLGDACKHISW